MLRGEASRSERANEDECGAERGGGGRSEEIEGRKELESAKEERKGAAEEMKRRGERVERS